MIVRFKKIDENGAAISCHRRDGSTTWQRPKANHSTFFAIHDLTHFAVESELRPKVGFFSLIADGWEIEDFENLSQNDRELPDDAGLTELLVGQLDMERASQGEWNADQFNEYMRTHLQSRNLNLEFKLEADQLARIKAHRDELISRWHGVPKNECLELKFENRSTNDKDW